MTAKEKREELAKLIEKKVQLGIDISDYMGRNLNYFNWEAIIEFNKKHEQVLN